MRIYSCLFLFACISCTFHKTYIAVHPIIAPIRETVFASGHVESSDQFTLSATNDGAILQQYFYEGDKVKKGQIIFVQDASNSLVQLKNAAENLTTAKNNMSNQSAVLKGLQIQLKTALTQLQHDSIQNIRYQTLLKTNAVSKVDADNALLAFNTSANNVYNIQETIKNTQINLQQALDNAAATYYTAQNTSRYYNITSPEDAVIYALYKKKGDYVRKNDNLSLLGNHRFIAVLDIDEQSISKINVHQPVYIVFNSNKNQVYTGSVIKIYPLFNSTAITYRVDCSLDSIPTTLINGTILQANILIQQKDKAMLIPRSAFNLDGSVHLLTHDNKVDTIQVTPGIVSTNWVEIEKGLSLKDAVITN